MKNVQGAIKQAIFYLDEASHQFTTGNTDRAYECVSMAESLCEGVKECIAEMETAE